MSKYHQAHAWLSFDRRDELSTYYVRMLLNCGSFSILIREKERKKEGRKEKEDSDFVFQTFTKYVRKLGLFLSALLHYHVQVAR